MSASSEPNPSGPSVQPPKKRSKTGVAIAIVVILLVLAGGLYYMGVFQGSGTVQAYFHDSPCTCEHVYVTITSVALLRSNGTTYGSGSWVTVGSASHTYDALALNGSQNAVLLASGSTTAVSYTALQLTFQNVTVVTLGGARITAQVSGPTVRVNGPISVSSSGTTTIMIDLDLAESIQLSGSGAVFTASLSMVAS